MERVLVIGCPGSGKSVFSRKLRDRTGLPLIHLDRLYWDRDGTTVPPTVFSERLTLALEQERWIIDGNYASTMERRLQACDTVFFLDYPMEVCLAGIEARKGQLRSDLPWREAETPDTEFLQFVRRFSADSRPVILSLMERYPEKDWKVFLSREQAQRYLNGLET